MLRDNNSKKILFYRIIIPESAKKSLAIKYRLNPGCLSQRFFIAGPDYFSCISILCFSGCLSKRNLKKNTATQLRLC